MYSTRCCAGGRRLKTVFNLGTNVGNILSNVDALHVGDVPGVGAAALLQARTRTT
jgi:hypothetical protein